MDEPGSTYAPQSPDLSGYHSSSTAPRPHQHDPYAAPSYQPSPSQYIPPQSSYHPPQMPGHYQYPQQQQQQPSRNGSGQRIKHQQTTDDADADWLPHPLDTTQRPMDNDMHQAPSSARPRSGKKNKLDFECEKPAPGAAEGIAVKTKFPIARIKRLIQSDDEVGKVAQTTPTGVCKSFLFFPARPFLSFQWRKSESKRDAKNENEHTDESFLKTQQKRWNSSSYTQFPPRQQKRARSPQRRSVRQI